LVEPRLGQVVSSRAGRDRGKLFVIVSRLDDATVCLADGMTRTVDHPKRKNLRHLTVHPIVARELGERLASGGRPSNQELRRYLAALSDARQAQPKEGDSVDGEAGCH
jgi:ribosomal protein L14E/L6E/L27E